MRRRSWGVALCMVVLVSACAPTPSRTPSPSPTSASPTAPTSSAPPSPTGSPSPSPSASPEVRAVSLGTATVEGSTISVEPLGTVKTTDIEPDGVTLTAQFDDAAHMARLELHFKPEQSDLTVDGGVAVVSTADGAVQALVPEPDVVDANGEPVPVAMHAIDTTLVIVAKPEERNEGRVDVTMHLGKRLISRVDVDEEQGAPRFLVFRTEFGQQFLGGGLGNPGALDIMESAGWEEAVALAPELASTPSLKQQYDCHVLGAPRKSSWNLEAFRPDHPDWLPGALQHRCNWEEQDLPTASPAAGEGESPDGEASPSEAMTVAPSDGPSS